jgi:hypothetical protein
MKLHPLQRADNRGDGRAITYVPGTAGVLGAMGPPPGKRRWIIILSP